MISLRFFLQRLLLVGGIPFGGATFLNAADAAPQASPSPAPILFVANLRPVPGAIDSGGYGTATLLLTPDSDHAGVTVTYSNLTSATVGSHLKLGRPDEEGRFIKGFAADQSSIRFDWTITPSGNVSTSTFREALDNGLIYVAIDTQRHPAGELRGQFVRAAGVQTFTPPEAPPPIALARLTPSDAARFLTQATFGPKKSEIDALVAKGFTSWLDEQMSLPVTSLLEATRADFDAFPPLKGKKNPRPVNLQAGWWKIAVTAPDQLRQRVAFALSEILVVSDRNGALGNHADAVGAYYDLLARHAFGNFRQLLEEVTLSPVMGAYLSHLKNAKGDLARGTSADENYAREIMQLFTIGLNELQPDGTYRLGQDGLPIPTYTQKTVTETARVFTGWGFHTDRPRRDFRSRPDFFQPMTLYPALHDNGEKTIIGNQHLPAGQGGRRDLEMTLDALCNHPNTGPFVCRQLIQRLVTSNPSPGYVYRVAQVFANNGRDERGDLGAVVRAVLLDYEARSPEVLGNLGHGKLKEPVLQVTALLRAFDGAAANGRYFLPKADGSLGQTPLHSPTVFNFFEPDYVLPGPLAAAGLRAPEYQILTATTAITVPNFLRSLISTPPQPRNEMITLKLEPLIALANSNDVLIDYCDLVFCSGGMSPEARSRIDQALRKLPRRAPAFVRARTALDLTVTSADAAIQR